MQKDAKRQFSDVKFKWKIDKQASYWTADSSRGRGPILKHAVRELEVCPGNWFNYPVLHITVSYIAVDLSRPGYLPVIYRPGLVALLALPALPTAKRLI